MANSHVTRTEAEDDMPYHVGKRSRRWLRKLLFWVKESCEASFPRSRAASRSATVTTKRSEFIAATALQN